jgi:hypothetical protein
MEPHPTSLQSQKQDKKNGAILFRSPHFYKIIPPKQYDHRCS